MAKKALLDVLEQTIGKYVKNLDAESLNLAVWSGKVALSHLELDVDAVNAELDRQAAEAPNLAVPLQVISGKFDSFEVDVPWASLTKKSVILRARGLRVSVRSYNRLVSTDHLNAVASSEQARATKIREARENSIQISEKYRQQTYAVRKLAAEADDTDHNNEIQSSTFSSRLVRRIIENVQIEINDVHISLTDGDGSAGVVLESLQLVTTDKDGKQVFVDRTKDSEESSFLHKMLLMQGFGIYLDHEDSKTERFVSARTSLGAISESFSTHQSEDSSLSPPAPTPMLDHTYILSPLSFQANLRQADGKFGVEYARYKLSSELSSLSILLSKQQLELARRISEEVSTSKAVGACPLFPEYRPMTRVTSGDAAREWWRYAFRCIGRMNGRRSWMEFFQAYQKRKEYIPLYKRYAHHQTCPWIKPLSPEESSTLKILEQDRTISVEGIMAWRNIADAQADMEKEKRAATRKDEKKTSYFASIFGTSKQKEEDEEENEPPISLSADELRDLEAMSREQFEDPDNVSKDSKVFDAKFVLNSLRVNLISHDLRHLATLEMGAITADFNAVANGAFTFNFDLSDLEVQDRVTPNSLFPSVLKSTQAKEWKTAFHLFLSKSSSGDKSLKLQLAAFEVVASHLLFKECKAFAATASKGPRPKGTKQNPILAQSLSGSVDLFYDADQGESALNLAALEIGDEHFFASSNNMDLLSRNKESATATSDLSGLLVDAWKEKTASKSAWSMDVDIKAPVIIVPEKCNDPRASLLVFDLGHLKSTYGMTCPSNRVKTWFDDHPNLPAGNLAEMSYEGGNLSFDDLAFKVGTVDDVSLLLGRHDSEISETSVVDPISLSLDLGVESISSESPRICCMGVIPTICLRISPQQGAKIVSVLGSWTSLLGQSEAEKVTHDDEDVSSGQNSIALRAVDEAHPEVDELSTTSVERSPIPQFYFLVGLQRLSINISVDPQNYLEFHLVSVFASGQMTTDGCAVVGIRMGWFWILDRLQSSHTRRQRLLAHSKLPLPAEHFTADTADNENDILGELRKQGVFSPEYSGSTELADISLTVNASPNKGVSFEGEEAELLLHATFSSLFIHWNPHAIKRVSNVIQKLSSLADEVDESTPLIVSPERPKARNPPTSDSPKKYKLMKVVATMDRLELILNSALDDFPLFILTVSKTEIGLLSWGDNMEASLGLGDIRVCTPENMGKTIQPYRTLLGMAPGHTVSLLNVKYRQGPEATAKVQSKHTERAKLEAFADVELSPMRMCFIQSQVMALVEYFSEGILGALAAFATASAAQKAADFADSFVGEKFFQVRATSFDLVLPQSAYDPKAIKIGVGALSVDYKMFPGTGGSVAIIELSDVVMSNPDGDTMQDEPINMFLNVKLPSQEVGSLDDQAMRVDIKISDASFCILRSDYLQILKTLEENTGELQLFLRDETVAARESSTSLNQIDNSPDSPLNTLTHAGNQFIEKQQRMLIQVSIGVMALKLCKSSSEAIVHVAAVDARIYFQSFPDTLTKSSTITLRNLVCEDLREKASVRQYRHLFRQESVDDKKENIFSVAYSSGNEETSLSLTVGSPQIVLIPDAISEVLAFIQQDAASGSGARSEKGTTRDTDAHDPSLTTSFEHERLVMHSPRGHDEIEVALVPSIGIIRSHVSATTGICRIVLVDLGSQLSTDPNQQTQLTETVVLQGIFSASLSTVSEISNGTAIETNFDGHADSMEIFTAFGRDMRSSFQILEPSNGSAHGSMKSITNGGKEIEVRAAALTPFDFTVSMHNAALLNAIAASLQSTFSSSDEDRTVNFDLEGLTKAEQEHIEMLAQALESASDRTSIGYHASSSSIGSFSGNHPAESLSTPGTKVQIKLTMPETKIAVINDLQGLDEALFRASVTNFVAGVQVDQYGTPGTVFDFHMNTSILADYFDTTCNIWNKLLVRPWELTLKGTRAVTQRFRTDRLSTTMDLESFPCIVSFSEPFLASLASASRMWSIYSVATRVNVDGNSKLDTNVKESAAASAARNLVTSMPYAVENNTGLDLQFSLSNDGMTNYPCDPGSLKYFRFEPPRDKGSAGRRVYGQDLNFEKTISLHFNDGSTITIGNIDFELGLPRKTHQLKESLCFCTQVVKDGKSSVLRLSSHISLVNNTCLPFEVRIAGTSSGMPIGQCSAYNQKQGHGAPLWISDSGIASAESKRFCVPADMLSSFHDGCRKKYVTEFALSVLPSIPGETHGFHGTINVAESLGELRKMANRCSIKKFDVVCSPASVRAASPLVIQVIQTTVLEDDNVPTVEVRLEPRAIIENKFPLLVQLRTPMPHTFSEAKLEESPGKDVLYSLQTGDHVEVFTPGPSIAVTVTTGDAPIAGCDLDWLDGGWIDLPLVSEFSLVEPVRCLLPFTQSVGDVMEISAAQGSEFFIAEGASALLELSAPEEGRRNSAVVTQGVHGAGEMDPEAPLRTFYLTVCAYGIDHTGDILFEQVSRSDPAFRMTMNDSFSESSRAMKRHSRKKSTSIGMNPFGAFGSDGHNCRITLLPTGNVPLRILQMTMDSDGGYRRSLPFFIEELPIGEGGVDTIPIMWENKKPSGYYAYRSIINDHQIEVHLIPEFQVFNGNNRVVLVEERYQPEVIVEAGKVLRLAVGTRPDGLEISLNFIEHECKTSFFRVDKLGMKMVMLKSNSGAVVGSVCVQTIIDTHGESRLVVKIGEIDVGNVDTRAAKPSQFFGRDFCRLRVRWTELQLILNEMQTSKDSSWTVAKALSKWGMPSNNHGAGHVAHALDGNHEATDMQKRARIAQVLMQPVATIIFSRFTFDFQRVFKDQDYEQGKVEKKSPERSQISLIVHSVTIKDLTPDSSFPTVFECSSEKCSFFDLCIRVRGPLDADIIAVDLFDLNLAHANGFNEKIKLTTSEEYVWRLIDLFNRILAASGDIGGYCIKVEDSEEHGTFNVRIENTRSDGANKEVEYTPPKSDTLYDVNVARVSPFCLLVSFKRDPQKSRYKKISSKVAGAAMMNYFSRKLKFTIDRAELNFARYEDRSLKGPPGRLAETLFAVYTSRMKFKLITLLTAASLQDWKYLAARGQGDDDYVEGDILRATGNLTGKASHLIFQRAGEKLGDGVSEITRAFGNTIEKTSGFIGAGRVGAGVNSVVSGVGDGVGSALTGVSSGTGKVLKGAGQGLGHAFGGVTGGALQIGKGIGKGIVRGDGKAFVDGFSTGIASAGGGIATGAESAVVGAADGLFSAGRGLLSGAKSVTKGFGGAFTGKKPEKKKEGRR